jgi:membrane protein insertase Oxa1/YidC/SpoIIIJ
MGKRVYFRLIVYILLIAFYRVVYILAAFQLGFGSASNHAAVDIVLNIVLVLLNVITYYIIQRLLKVNRKRELLWILALTSLIWITLYFNYN